MTGIFTIIAGVDYLWFHDRLYGIHESYTLAYLLEVFLIRPLVLKARRQTKATHKLNNRTVGIFLNSENLLQAFPVPWLHLLTLSAAPNRAPC